MSDPMQEVKLHRDELVDENQTLAEANRRYRMHTTELKDRVQSLLVSMNFKALSTDYHHSGW